jgi:hypothetical protein
VDPQAALYQQLDPARPLEADQDDLYVDWQEDLGLENVKARLARSIALSAGIPVCRLFTGHRGSGKTTELKRVRRMLETGAQGSRLFVSVLQAVDWMDLQDVAPTDIVFKVVRQLVADLETAGYSFAPDKLKAFAQDLWDQIRHVGLKDLKLTAGAAELSLVLKEVPGARGDLRRLLEKRLPNIHQLINDEILAQASKRLAEDRGFDGILVIVDELDRIPQKIIGDGLTNHENVFVDHAHTLRFLNCHVLYTIPIELAYSRCRTRLETTFGDEIFTLPAIPVSRRDGTPHDGGTRELCRIVEERARKAGIAGQDVFADRTVLERLCRLSGGHLKSLFLWLRSLIVSNPHWPLADEQVERWIRRQADKMRATVRQKEWAALEKVHQSKRPVGEDSDLWHALLRELLVFPYEDETGSWYDWNPMVGEVRGGS